MRQAVAVAALLLSVAASPLAAQSAALTSELAEVQPGARVRVTAPGLVAGRYVATVLARSDDTLTLGSPTSRPIAVPIARISSLQVSRGKDRGLGALNGIKWGVPIGLGVGLVLRGTTSNCVECGGDEYSKNGWIGVGVLSGVFYGSIIGAIAGKERWDSFDLPHRTAFGIGANGATFAMRLTY